MCSLSKPLTSHVLKLSLNLPRDCRTSVERTFLASFRSYVGFVTTFAGIWHPDSRQSFIHTNTEPSGIVYASIHRHFTIERLIWVLAGISLLASFFEETQHAFASWDDETTVAVSVMVCLVLVMECG